MDTKISFTGLMGQLQAVTILLELGLVVGTVRYVQVVL